MIIEIERYQIAKKCRSIININFVVNLFSNQVFSFCLKFIIIINQVLLAVGLEQNHFSVGIVQLINQRLFDKVSSDLKDNK